MLTRADRVDDANGNPTTEHTNLTTPFVDQNQTYVAPAHQVFLRVHDGANATGELIEGTAGGMATWTDVKTSRAWSSASTSPTPTCCRCRRCSRPYGNFVPGPARGMPQLIVANGPNVQDVTFVEGNLPRRSRRRRALDRQAFLDDIAHGATPLFDAAGNLGGGSSTERRGHRSGQPGLRRERRTVRGNDLPPTTQRSSRALHAGDGRVTRNRPHRRARDLHSEHNRMVGQIEDL